MIVLHAAFHEPPHEAAALHFWTESRERLSRAVARRGRRPAVEEHPFAGAGDETWEALTQLLEPGRRAEARSESTILFLPSADRAPLPSPDLRGGDPPAGRVELRPWRVPTCRLTCAEAASLLAALGKPSDDGHVVRVAADLQPWCAAARWVLALLARGRMVPALAAPQDGQPARIRWMPVLDDPKDARRLAVLAASLPPAARADAVEAPDARAAILRFVGEAIDALASALGSRGRPPAIPESWPEAARAWAGAVTGGRAAGLDAPPNAMRRFSQELERWMEPLRPAQAAAFRTCFRLVPPEGGASHPITRRSLGGDREVAPEVASRRPGAWRAEILLQAGDDPSLLIPAEQVWRSRGRVLKAHGRSHANPQERLLQDLGRASRVFPALERALQEAHPEGCALDDAEAVAFMTKDAWLLEESGFGVLVPSRDLLGGGLKLRLTVSEPQRKRQASTGKLGLQALVDFRWEVSIGDQVLTFAEFMELAALKTPLVQVRGQWVLLDRAQVEQALETWRQADAHRSMALGDALRMASAADPRTGDAVSVEIHLAGALAALEEGGPLRMLDHPADFRGTLRPYQLRGYSWLSFLRERGLGACLADDMGLGKTIQLISLLLREPKGSPPVLLICPTSVVGNWERELLRFAPGLRVLIHHGSDRLTGEAFAAEAEGHDLVLTTFGLTVRDADTLRAVAWNGVVLDEAQNIKNPDAKQARVARSIPAGFRIAMTGTPVENRLTDLWSIMEFLNPGLLGSAERFRRQFVLPVERYGNAERSAQLRRVVQPFLLRRLKTDPTIIQDLPEKQEMKVYCPLTREQATLYQAAVLDIMRKIQEADGMSRRGLVLSGMLRLKQICNHPAHFLADGSALPGRSGKLQRLQEMLEEAVAAGDAALVFTQFTEMGERLRGHLSDALGREVLFLHGGTTRPQRDRMVERFQSEPGPPVFVLSVKAGGVGLNLTRACHVFHFDRWWNPAVENQATDRAFRIGQRRNVQVHKMICQGTLEEAIDQLIESKLALADSVVGSGEAWLTELGNDQLRELFALRAGAVEEEA